jgi:tRNA (cytidine/uridine-2'-O-)-methyltransferase
MLNIVLVQPRIPQNTGNIARTCAATGSRLHLVKPMAFEVSDAKLKRAGLDYWHLLDITYHQSLEAFLQSEKGIYRLASTKAKKVYTEADYPDNCYLIFGREDQGLPEYLLAAHSNSAIRIPQIAEARSLNLSNAVAVIAFEALRQQGFPALKLSGGLF